MSDTGLNPVAAACSFHMRRKDHNWFFEFSATLTHLASVGFVSSVDSDVHLQLVFSIELVSAEIAREWFLS